MKIQLTVEDLSEEDIKLGVSLLNQRIELEHATSKTYTDVIKQMLEGMKEGLQGSHPNPGSEGYGPGGPYDQGWVSTFLEARYREKGFNLIKRNEEQAADLLYNGKQVQWYEFSGLSIDGVSEDCRRELENENLKDKV